MSYEEDDTCCSMQWRCDTKGHACKMLPHMTCILLLTVCVVCTRVPMRVSACRAYESFCMSYVCMSYVGDLILLCWRACVSTISQEDTCHMRRRIHII
jgi:hypothetical protein